MSLAPFPRRWRRATFHEERTTGKDSMSLKNRIIGLAAVGATALAVTAPVASAATSPCATLSYAPVFAPYLDFNSYFLAPAGGFEPAATGWAVGSASVVLDGGVPLTLMADTHSLEIPAGQTVTSPAVCANANTPTFRFMAKARALGASSYTVAVTYLDGAGAKQKAAASYTPSVLWSPTPAIKIKTSQIKTDSTGWGTVQVSITAPSNSALRIDDLYIDPRMH